MNRSTHTAITFLLLLVVLAVTLPAIADEAAATLFKSKCAGCHAADGTGNTPVGQKLGVKPLGGAEVQGMSDADLQKAIATGKGKMPGFGTKLTAAELKAIVAHIRTFAKK
ncbi:MAG TPA: cytochrome c [Thermoanaerobaculia bacterium]